MSVRVPVVIVENQDSEDHAGRHHPLDEIEIGPCTSMVRKQLIISLSSLPIKGTASLVMGISSDTMFMKTVRERRTVTPEINHGI